MRLNALLALFLMPLSGWAQTNINGTINTYARVTAIAGATLTVTNINGVSTNVTTFNNGLGTGSRAILIQMRGATVNTAAATTSTNHGNLTTINNAGNWEWVQVASTAAGTITLSAAPTLAYTVGGDVQIVHAPYYTGTLVNVIGDLTCPTFSTTTFTGGVIAVAVEQTLRLSANVIANSNGFAGGAASNGGTAGACDNTTFATATVNGFAVKGSSVAAFTANTRAIGNWASGGGGGSSNNAGGAGGANFTDGGNGSWGRQGLPNCGTAPGGGGEQGVALDYSTGKIFLGSGGGGGQGGTAGTAGANGAGIVIIRANTLAVSGARTISANGGTAADSPTDAPGGPGLGSDGAGGGGAGGVVYLDVINYNLPGSPGCLAGLITVQANGGNGGNSIGTDGAYRGGGAGGGAGYIGLANTAVAGQCITFSAAAGAAGTSCTTCGVVGGSGGTTPGSPTTGPVIPVGTLPSLPIRLLTFSGQRIGADIALKWVTASELNNSHFSVERSVNSSPFAFVGTVSGSGTTQQTTAYSFVDPEVQNGELRYRLRQIDYDGTEAMYGPIRIGSTEGDPTLSLVQNPVRAGDAVGVTVSGVPAGSRVELLDLSGRMLAYQIVSDAGSQLVLLRATELAAGTYIVRLSGSKLAVRVIAE